MKLLGPVTPKGSNDWLMLTRCLFESHSGPFDRPNADSKEEESRAKHQQRKQQRTRSRPHSQRKWSRSGRNADGHMADVKIELGPMPFDPKY